MNRRVDSDDSWLFATVTATNPLRVRLDGDATQIASTPITLVSGLAVNDRVWCQLHGLQLVIHGRNNGVSSALSGTLVRVGSAARTSSTSNTTNTFNVTTVTLPQSVTVTGTRFRIVGQANITPDTAGSYSDLEIHIGQNASVGGTIIASSYIDHRIVGRIVACTVLCEYVYAETQNVSDMNVVLVVDPENGALVSASADRPASLIVDRVMP